MELIKYLFIGLVVGFGGLLKRFSFGLVEGLKIHLDVIVEIFNIVKGRYLTK